MPYDPVLVCPGVRSKSEKALDSPTDQSEFNTVYILDILS